MRIQGKSICEDMSPALARVAREPLGAVALALRLERRRQETARAQFGDLQLQTSRSRVEDPLAAAVAELGSHRYPRAAPRRHLHGRLGIYEPVHQAFEQAPTTLASKWASRVLGHHHLGGRGGSRRLVRAAKRSLRWHSLSASTATRRSSRISTTLRDVSRCDREAGPDRSPRPRKWGGREPIFAG